jgi:RNA polymerase sigma factor (sigma-70 family)
MGERLPTFDLAFAEALPDSRPRNSGLGAPGSICYPRGMSKGRAPDPPFAVEALRHADALHHFARYLTRESVAAEELVQETFARCFSARAQFTEGSNLRAWRFRILRNAFTDGRRRSRNNPGRRGIDAEDASDDDLRDGDRLRGDVEIDRLRGLVAEDIEAALMSLSADARGPQTVVRPIRRPLLRALVGASRPPALA